ncbi:MAG TPA: hypothetical protein VGG48_01920 [Rhizomicrobium sp.]|jgi:hypothetical protein
MTINTGPVRFSYVADGTTTAFGFNHPFFAASDVSVILYDTVADAPLDPAPALNGMQPYDYMVDGVLDAVTAEYLSGANIEFNSAPAAGLKVVLLLAVPATQSLIVRDNSKFPAQGVNLENDRLTVLIKQVLLQMGYALQIPATEEPNASYVLASAAARAGKLLGFDPVSGLPMLATPTPSSFTLPDINTTTGFASLQLADAAAGGALLFSTANLTVTANYTMVSDLEAWGGIITVPDGVTLHTPSANGVRKMFVCQGSGQVIFDAPKNAIPTMLFCDPGDGITHDCLAELTVCFASQPYNNASWWTPARRHHLSAPLTFSNAAWANQTLLSRGTVFDHAIRLPSPNCCYVGGTHDAALNPIPVGQKVSGFEHSQDRGSTIIDITVNNFPENGAAFGTHDAVALADYQVQTGVFINCRFGNNGRNGIYARSLASLSPRSWFNLNHLFGISCDQNGQGTVFLDSAAQYNSFFGLHAELNNRAWGFAINTAVGTFLGGEIVTGSVSGATAMVSRFSAGAGALIVYNVVGEFQTGEAVSGRTSGASCNLVKHACTTLIASGAVTGAFQLFEVATGTAGATGKVADWDAASGVLTLYDVVGGFNNGDTVTGVTSGASFVCTGLILGINTDLVGDYTPGETVIDETSGATAVVVSWTHGNRHLEVTDIVGSFSSSHLVLGETSGAVGTCIHVIQGGGALGGMTACQVLDFGSLVGAFVAEEMVTGSLSGVTGYIFVTAGGEMGLRGVNPNGDDFVFRVGETVTGSVSAATCVVTTSHLGGGWSSQIFISGGDNSLHHVHTQDEINMRFVIDVGAGIGNRTSFYGGRYAGDIHGVPYNLTGFQGNGTHVATQIKRVTVNQLVKLPRRITITTAATVVLLPSDEIVHITNQYAASPTIQWPASPSPSQRIEIMDIGNSGADVHPFTILNPTGAPLDTIDTKGGWSIARLIDAVNVRLCP